MNIITNGKQLNALAGEHIYDDNTVYEIKNGEVFIATCSDKDCDCGLPHEEKPDED